MPRLKWSDVDEIAYRLSQRLPEVDPLTVWFTELHRWVRELEDFDDDPAASTEGILEAIQMSWAECRKEGGR
jgi:FeS assembly protein IscX